MKTYLTIFLAAMLSLPLHAQVIITFAGTAGVSGFSGDGGSAGGAEFYDVYGIAVDKKGNVYIADYNNKRIRKINADGIISTFAGNGGYGAISGDGGPATAAVIDFPTSVAVDGVGNVYISESITMRKVDTMGIISTFAGSGAVGYSGDGGPATDAALYGIMSCVTVDCKGNVYFQDGYRIRKVNTSGIISTVAGNGTSMFFGGDGGPATDAELGYTSGIAVDSIGNMYISNYVYCNVRKVDTSGIINIFAGPATTATLPNGFAGDGGPATMARLNTPMGLAVDREGNLYISDDDNSKIREVNTSGIINTIAGVNAYGYSGDGGPATDARLNYPQGVAVDSGGNVYIADYGNSVIRKVIIDGVAAVNSIPKSANALNIFPNPIPPGGLLHINEVQYLSGYQLLSIVGTVVQNGSLLPGNNNISVQPLPPDVYILQVTNSDGQKTTSKIIKQ